MTVRKGKSRRRGPGEPPECLTCGTTDLALFKMDNRSRCRPCRNARAYSTPERRANRLLLQKKLMAKRRQYIWDYLHENPCMVCGESDPVVLTFDHRDPSRKVAGIAVLMGRQRKWELVLEEIAKCDVLCSNCHLRKTAKQLGWFSNLHLLREDRNL